MAQIQPYKRVLLKLSGEAIAKKDDNGHVTDIFDTNLIGQLAGVIRDVVHYGEGVSVGIVIGGGNIWRGAYGKDVTRARADQMGMLSTMINSMRMEDALEKAGCPARVMTPIVMNGFTTSYNFRDAMKLQKEGGVPIFGGGLGVPYVTTDTTCVVRAVEMQADVILMAKNIDGIYESDPRDPVTGQIDPSVRRYKTVSYDDCLAKNLHATDVSASAIAKEQKINMYLFGLSDPENILRVIRGEEIGTLVTYEHIPAVLY